MLARRSPSLRELLGSHLVQLSGNPAGTESTLTRRHRRVCTENRANIDLATKAKSILLIPIMHIKSRDYNRSHLSCNAAKRSPRTFVMDWSGPLAAKARLSKGLVSMPNTTVVSSTMTSVLSEQRIREGGIYGYSEPHSPSRSQVDSILAHLTITVARWT
jgi:hypothetical protein